ncbi:hypothetical protein DXG03_001538 [Asterophora parasitica]|uniref:Uncharacterized protein n=1 Tax=Asterophora parasitica TaxID=117018 RepID=A0A9P7G304_9AGAR|nr:hypothetical protein DXG03_001538 [Asterophora parasitica]
MHSRSILVAFLTLALSSFSAQAAPAPSHHRADCEAPIIHTVVRTVTVTAGATATPKPNNTNQGGDKVPPINHYNGNNSNGGGVKTTTTAATTSKAVTTTAATSTKADTTAKVTTTKATTSVKATSTNAGTTSKVTTTHAGTTSKATTTHIGTTSKATTTNASTTAKVTTTKAATTVKGTTAHVGTTSKVTTTNASTTAKVTTTKAATTTNAGTTTTAASTTLQRGNDDVETTIQALSPQVIARGFANDGQDVPTAGQVPSLTSTNNFINFCLTVPNLPITDGKQITTGSCNPAPIGAIPSTDNMPSSKFAFPANFGTVKANTPFTIQMNIQNLQTGFFVNAQSNYFAAPQQLNGQGQIQGHSHVVVEQLTALDQGTPTDPKKFAFFKGLNAAAAGGQLTADVTAGLPAGFYKLSSINTASNHQPVIVPVAQHGSLDDAIYFTVTADGNPLPGSVGAEPPAASLTASSTASEEATSTSVNAKESVAASSAAGAAPTEAAPATDAAAAKTESTPAEAPAEASATAPAARRSLRFSKRRL